MLFLFSLALGGTYSAELAVPSRHYLVHPDEPTGAERVLAYVDGLEDHSVSSSHPAVSCFSEKGYIVAKMFAIEKDYPKTFPFAATCTFQGDTVNLTVVKMHPETDPSLQDWNIDTNNRIHITRPNKAAMLRAYRLRECADAYVYNKRVAASGLDGVYCEAKLSPSGEEMLNVFTVEGADLGVGVCSMPLAHGDSVDITVNLSSGPI